MASWRRRHEAKAEAARARLISDLRGRAAVREAESLVGSAWIDGLDRAEQADPTVRHLLERERDAFVRATRRRTAEAERDQHRLAAVVEERARSAWSAWSAPPSG
ncbi:hypothetical protein [Catenulispora subtropica]|uniref:hypothetical protein n=1 Tax=Catenulispora subtropica TaxID=450798 RepID=UPI0031CE0793